MKCWDELDCLLDIEVIKSFEYRPHVTVNSKQLVHPDFKSISQANLMLWQFKLRIITRKVI